MHFASAFVLFIIVMEPLQQSISILQEEHIPEHVRGAFFNRSNDQPYDPDLKYATINEVKAFQRNSQTLNDKLLEERPLLFNMDQFSSSSQIHFVSQNSKHCFIEDGKEVAALDVVESNYQRLRLRIPISNIRRENILTLHLKNLRRKSPIELQNVQNQAERQLVRYKYLLTLCDINLDVKVLVKFDEEYKVWKEIEVPLAENRFQLQIHEFNNEHTEIRINDFKFHLVLKMPFNAQTNYRLFHEGKVEVEKVQFKSKPETISIKTNESYCTSECQLI